MSESAAVTDARDLYLSMLAVWGRLDRIGAGNAKPTDTRSAVLEDLQAARFAAQGLHDRDLGRRVVGEVSLLTDNIIRNKPDAWPATRDAWVRLVGEVEGSYAQVINSADDAAGDGDTRTAAWFRQYALIEPATLRNRDGLEGEKIGGRWHYRVRDVCHLYPDHAPRIAKQVANESASKRIEAKK